LVIAYFFIHAALPLVDLSRKNFAISSQFPLDARFLDAIDPATSAEAERTYRKLIGDLQRAAEDRGVTVADMLKANVAVPLAVPKAALALAPQPISTPY
jgi:hypothetical protein